MAKIKEDKLLISEIFYSVQCEGITTGIPAVFIRLANCNLSCGFSPGFVNDFKKLDKQSEGLAMGTAGELTGDLMTLNKATWCCDTMPVWIKGTEWSFQEVLDWFKSEGIYDDIIAGKINIIWTGGEPTIPGHQESIKNFVKEWIDIDPKSDNVFYEIETNGTLDFQTLFPFINQINCSPKLSNSGMPTSQRLRPEVITQIMNHPNYQFKFVVSTEDDIFEMFNSYIEPLNIPLKNVVCMPGLDDQNDFHERTRWVLEMAKKYKFRGLTRLHVAAWGRTTGV